MQVQPPSTTRLCPVMCLALSDTKNNAVLAMSVTEAGLPIGVSLLQVAAYAASSNVRSVNVAPGAMPLTLILYCDSSITKFLASLAVIRFLPTSSVSAPSFTSLILANGH